MIDFSAHTNQLLLGLTLMGGVGVAASSDESTDTIDNLGPYAVAASIGAAAWNLSNRMNSVLQQGDRAQTTIVRASDFLEKTAANAEKALEMAKTTDHRIGRLEDANDELRSRVMEAEAILKVVVRHEDGRGQTRYS